MSMTLARALLLSSKHQAEGFIQHSSVIGVGYAKYKLLVSHVPVADDELEACLLHIFHITYPQREELKNKGKGWGDAKIAEFSHVEKSFKFLRDCQSFLRKYGISDEDGWQPVEDE